MKILLGFILYAVILLVLALLMGLVEVKMKIRFSWPLLKRQMCSVASFIWESGAWIGLIGLLILFILWLIGPLQYPV